MSALLEIIISAARKKQSRRVIYISLVVVSFFGIFLGYLVGSYSSTRRILNILSRSKGRDEQIIPEHSSLHRDIIAWEKALHADAMEYVIIHSGDASKGFATFNSKKTLHWENVLEDSYVFSSDILSDNPRLRPSVGNGHIATAVFSQVVCMHGLYNGAGTDSHRAAIPSPVAWQLDRIEPEDPHDRHYFLDVSEGIFKEVIASKHYTVTHRLYAHRSVERLIVSEVEVALDDEVYLESILLRGNTVEWQSPDLKLTKHSSNLRDVSYYVGETLVAENETSGTQFVHIVSDDVPGVLQLPSTYARFKWVFLTAIAATREEAFEAYRSGLQLIHNNNKLHDDHVDAWLSLWSEGRIDIHGSVPIARAVYASFYYILSSLPLSPKLQSFVGLSPAGLPFGYLSTDYQGHVFWDQETWMYPPLLLFHPTLALRVLSSRKRTMSAASANYQSSVSKGQGQEYKGLRYPWESGFTGMEVSPCRNCSNLQLHVSGDISLAILQYVWATGNSVPLEEAYVDILKGIALFWKSRLEHNLERGLYEIRGVMPPDEYHYPVDNSAYTNVIARLSLLAPNLVERFLGREFFDVVSQIVNDIAVPYDEDYAYHPEYEGYKIGTKVKQADVVMLGYPLLYDMPPEIRKNDLKIYEKVTDPNGPAMSWSMFSIGWLEVGDVEKGEAAFKKNFDYIYNDFQVWTETERTRWTEDDATNFITGMGGFLQNIIFGFVGVRLRQDRLTLNPRLPEGTTGMHLRSIHYRGTTMDIYITPEEIAINVLSVIDPVLPLKLSYLQPETTVTLAPRAHIRFITQSAYMYSGDSSDDDDSRRLNRNSDF